MHKTIGREAEEDSSFNQSSFSETMKLLRAKEDSQDSKSSKS